MRRFIATKTATPTRTSSARTMTEDQKAFATLIREHMKAASIRGATPLINAMLDRGLTRPSYETIVKAVRGHTPFPAKYIPTLVDALSLTGEASAHFGIVAAFAHLPCEVAPLLREAVTAGRG